MKTIAAVLALFCVGCSGKGVEEEEEVADTVGESDIPEISEEETDTDPPWQRVTYCAILPDYDCVQSVTCEGQDLFRLSTDGTPFTPVYDVRVHAQVAFAPIERLEDPSAWIWQDVHSGPEEESNDALVTVPQLTPGTYAAVARVRPDQSAPWFDCTTSYAYTPEEQWLAQGPFEPNCWTPFEAPGFDWEHMAVVVVEGHPDGPECAPVAP